MRAVVARPDETRNPLTPGSLGFHDDPERDLLGRIRSRRDVSLRSSRARQLQSQRYARDADERHEVLLEADRSSVGQSGHDRSHPVTLDVTLKAKTGAVGVASVYLATGNISATTGNELALKMAAAGPGASQWVIVRRGEPARFADVVPGGYSVCSIPYPAEVKGMAAMTYAERHGDSLLAFCKPISVGAAPESQSVILPIELPPYVADTPPAGSGSGSGSR